MPKPVLILRWFVAILVLVGLWQSGIAALSAGKAWLAPVLIERAWAAGETGPVSPPWPWADGRPEAVIEAPALEVKRYVLSDASMRMLAFGPVSLQTEAGRVFFGHNDTHFSFLQTLEHGDVLQVTGGDRVRRSYQVTGFEIMEEDAIRLPVDESGGYGQVVLITCYPFDARISQSSQRYVVTALAMPN